MGVTAQDTRCLLIIPHCSFLLMKKVPEKAKK